MSQAIANKTVTVKSTTDERTKSEATEIYSRLGMSLSTAINVFLHQSVLQGGMPFTPGDPFYSPSNIAALDEGLAEEARHEVAASCTADSFDDMLAAL